MQGTFKIKMINNTYNKVYLLRQLETNFNIKPFDITIDNKIQKIQMNGQFFNKK